MRELTYKNQHEIGFDIDCLSKWAKYVAVDEVGEWYCFLDTPYKHRSFDINKWYSQSQYYTPIPPGYAPKNFTGNWEESLFKINRENIVNYNGTAI